MFLPCFNQNIQVMNKREFKKAVDAIGGSLYQEMMTAYFNIEGIDKDAVADAIKEVLGATAVAKRTQMFCSTAACVLSRIIKNTLKPRQASSRHFSRKYIPTSTVQ